MKRTTTTKDNSLKRIVSIIAGSAASAIGLYLFYKFLSKKQIEEPKLKLLTLKQDVAEERFSLISNVKYNLHFELNPLVNNSSKADGALKLEFDLSSNEKNIFIDFAGTVLYIEINGVIVGLAKEGERVYLKKKYLNQGRNIVNISFKSNYSSSQSKGLIYFKSENDSRSYVYTDIEPCFSHLIFPCFNQPDLKATFKLTLSTLNDWNTFSCNKKSVEDKTQQTAFPFFSFNSLYKISSFEETEVIPVSSFGFSAGHFTKISEKDKQSIVLPSTRVEYRPKSNYDCLFNLINDSLQLLNTSLSTSFQFDCLSIVIVPHLSTQSSYFSNLILVDEDLIGDDIDLLSIYDKTLLYGNILSSLINRWFYIEITPKWYDDTWISKGLSIFFVFHILKQLSEVKPEEYSQFHNSWLLFSSKKTSAIEEDLYLKAHSLKNDVLDLHQSLDMFDSLTFFKGGSIFRYLYTIQGPELFFKGLRNLLRKYSGTSITYKELKEIFMVLEEEREIKNSQFLEIEPFLLNNGINELSYEIQTKKDTDEIESFIISQKPKGFNQILYNYKVNILLIYNDKEEECEVSIENKDVTLINKLKGKKKPVAVLLNKDDICYFKQVFSFEDTVFLTKNINKIKNPTDRLVISRELYEMIKTNNLKSEDYLDYVFTHLVKESDQLILEYLIKSSLSVIENYISNENKEKNEKKLLSILQEYYYLKFEDLKNTTINAMLSLISYENENDMDILLNFLQESSFKSKTPSLLRGTSEIIENQNNYSKININGLSLYTRKNLIQSIYESKYFNMSIKKELKGVLIRENEFEYYFKYTLEAALPDENKKEKIWNYLVYDTKYENSKINEAYMKGFLRKSQFLLMKTFISDRFYKDFLEVKSRHSTQYAIKFFKILNPCFIVSETNLEALNNLRSKFSPEDSVFYKEVDRVIFNICLTLNIKK